MTTDRPRKLMSIVQPPALRAGAEPFRHRFDRFAHFPAGGARWGGIGARSLALRSISRWLRPSGPTPAHSVFAPLLLDLRRLRRAQQPERPTRTVVHLAAILGNTAPATRPVCGRARTRGRTPVRRRTARS